MKKKKFSKFNEFLEVVLKGFNSIHGIETFIGEEIVNVDRGMTFSDLNIYLFNHQKSLSYWTELGCW